MKCRIIEYDGTPEEIRAVTNGSSEVRKVSNDNLIHAETGKHVFRHKNSRNWSDDEVKVLRECNYREAHSKLPDRTLQAIANKRHSLGLTERKDEAVKRNDEAVRSGEKHFKKSTIDKLRTRAVFLNKRAKYYITQYPNWSWQKALSQASMDYQTGKSLVSASKHLFKAVKWDTNSQNIMTINVFSDYADAKKCIDDEKVKDLSLREEYKYAVVEVKE